ncbi:MAG: sugar ABC transporter permease [Dehalococcoidia bacterium]|nr:sugar ABC transporter permease [Dehalococcoidia bacterium]
MDSEAAPKPETAPGLPRFSVPHFLRRLTPERIASLALIVPSVIAVGVFVYGFIGWSALVSVSEWNSVKPDYTFVGLSNFKELFGHFRFQADIRNTVVFTLLFVAVCLMIGLFLAALLDRGITGAMISVVIAATWQMSGFVMILYLAGLRAIPEELTEAARVRAGGRKRPVRRHPV